ncbi:hypothetical protein BaRGS_00033046, partial [Batillaria attramentaria]
PPRVTNLTLTGQNGSDVKLHPAEERSNVDVDCEWEDGNPTSRVRLLDRHGTVLASNEYDGGHFRHQLQEVRCNHAGSIRCEGPSATENKTAIFLVKCAPELSHNSLNYITVIAGKDEELSFPMRTHTDEVQECSMYRTANKTDANMTEVNCTSASRRESDKFSGNRKNSTWCSPPHSKNSTDSSAPHRYEDGRQEADSGFQIGIKAGSRLAQSEECVMIRNVLYQPSRSLPEIPDSIYEDVRTNGAANFVDIDNRPPAPLPSDSEEEDVVESSDYAEVDVADEVEDDQLGATSIDYVPINQILERKKQTQLQDASKHFPVDVNMIVGAGLAVVVLLSLTFIIICGMKDDEPPPPVCRGPGNPPTDYLNPEPSRDETEEEGAEFNTVPFYHNTQLRPVGATGTSFGTAADNMDTGASEMALDSNAETLDDIACAENSKSDTTESEYVRYSPPLYENTMP